MSRTIEASLGWIPTTSVRRLTFFFVEALERVLCGELGPTGAELVGDLPLSLMGSRLIGLQRDRARGPRASGSKGKESVASASHLRDGAAESRSTNSCSRRSLIFRHAVSRGHLFRRESERGLNLTHGRAELWIGVQGGPRVGGSASNRDANLE